MGDHEHIFYSEHCDRCGRNAEAIIDDLEQQLRWRDVEKELPERGELVLTYSKLAGASVDYLTTANKFTADHPVESGADVTHWKPITAPEGE